MFCKRTICVVYILFMFAFVTCIFCFTLTVRNMTVVMLPYDLLFFIAFKACSMVYIHVLSSTSSNSVLYYYIVSRRQNIHDDLYTQILNLCSMNAVASSHTLTDRQTDRQTGRQTGRQADRQTGRQTDRQTICMACQWINYDIMLS